MECIGWDPLQPYRFAACTDNGTVFLRDLRVDDASGQYKSSAQAFTFVLHFPYTFTSSSSYCHCWPSFPLFLMHCFVSSLALGLSVSFLCVLVVLCFSMTVSQIVLALISATTLVCLKFSATGSLDKTVCPNSRHHPTLAV